MKDYVLNLARPTVNKIALRPCPFCGSENLYIGWMHALGVGVACLDCKAKTRNFDLPDYSSKRHAALRLCFKASLAWNKRAS